ncbi:MAG TPA: molybdate ABC transporter substrate-binding protein [Isosphaeraceae bacterium]|nr:molybdate ABC transporter substrate-binding protein [Isosphaeraceae bacterium]
MKSLHAPLPKDWTVGVKVWVDRAGHAILGKGRLELLEGIDRCHSISAAAREMKMSYRHAWLMVQSINEAAGEPLVVASTGGQRGGGAQLTPRGRWAVVVFRELQDQLQQTAGTLLRRTTPSIQRTSVHVAAAVSLEEVLGQLLADFALVQPSVRVRAVFGGSDELADHVLAGAPIDLFLTAASPPLDRLEAAGIAEANTRTVLAENTLAAIGPADRDLPVRSSADLALPGVTRIALADPTSPLGGYTREYLTDLGLHDSLMSRVVYVDNSRAVGATVRAGSADVGLVYGSDAMHPPGCRLLFRARKVPSPIELSGAVVRQGRQLDHARSLLAFLSSRPATHRFRNCGFLPVSGLRSRSPN